MCCMMVGTGLGIEKPGVWRRVSGMGDRLGHEGLGDWRVRPKLTRLRKSERSRSAFLF